MRRSNGTSYFDQPKHGWPMRRVIASCQASHGPLVTRYYLFESKPVSLYLHRLHCSDEDRALHDHPWSFISILFHSGYYEHTPTGRFWRRRFSVLWRPAEWQHRLELVKPTWTLVVKFRRRREWGFVTQHGWMDWKEYGRKFCD